MDWKEKWSEDRGWQGGKEDRRAGGRLGSGLSKKIASHSRPTRAAGDHQSAKGYELCTLGPQYLTWTYLLVAIVCGLLLNTVGELRARILCVVPCSCT